MFYLVCGLSIYMYFIYNLILNITLVYALIIANLTIQVKLIEYSLIICCIKKRSRYPRACPWRFKTTQASLDLNPGFLDV